MKKMIDVTIGKLLGRYLAINYQKVNERVISGSYLNYLNSTLSNGYFIPYSTVSISPLAMVYILNHIIINNVKVIVEFGTGISTIYLNNLIEKHQLELKVYSIDHDKQWQDNLKNQYNLTNIDFISSELTTFDNFENQGYCWYDESFLSKINKGEVDLVIVDAPLRAGNTYGRAGAFKLFESEFSRIGFTIILDDTNDSSTFEIIKKYCPSAVQYKDFSVYSNGLKYIPEPLLLAK
jgi:hypothetical protein